MLQKNLLKLGFGEREIEVYLAIIELGKSTPAQIAKKTSINRTTVYANIKTLLKRGVIAEDLGGKSLYLFAQPFEALEKFIEKEEERLNDKKKLIKKTIKEIKDIPLQDKNYSVPKIRFIEEGDIESYLYKNMSRWHKSTQKIDGITWGFQDHSFAELYKDWVTWAIENFPDNQVQLISNRSQIERSMNKKGIKEKRTVKYWKDNLNFSSSQWVMGNYLIMAITRQRPHYMVEIYDEVMAHNMREVFKNIWQEI